VASGKGRNSRMWFTRLPWRSSFPVSAGVAGMSAFVGNVLPAWAQILGFAASAALFGFGIVAALWHFRPKGWFERTFGGVFARVLRAKRFLRNAEPKMMAS
jgi:hypothetical protein